MSAMRWLRSFDRVQIGNISVAGPAWLEDPDGGKNQSIDPSAISSSLPAHPPAERDSAGKPLTSVESYAALSPAQRWTYLNWLESGRNDAIPSAYLKLWLYGVERLCLIEGRVKRLDKDTLDDLIATLEQEWNNATRPTNYRNRVRSLQMLIDQKCAAAYSGVNLLLEGAVKRLKSGGGLTSGDVWCCLVAMGNSHAITGSVKTELPRIEAAMDKVGVFRTDPGTLATLPRIVHKYTALSPTLKPLGVFSVRIAGSVDLLSYGGFVDYLKTISGEVWESPETATPEISATPAGSTDRQSSAQTLNHFLTIEGRYLAHLNRTARLDRNAVEAMENELCEIIYRCFSDSFDLYRPALDLLTVISADPLSSDVLCKRPLANRVLDHEPTLLRVLQHYADQGEGLPDNIFAELAYRRLLDDPRVASVASHTAKIMFARHYRNYEPVKAIVARESKLAPFQYVPMGSGKEVPRSVDVFYKASAGNFHCNSFEELYEACLAANAFDGPGARDRVNRLAEALRSEAARTRQAAQQPPTTMHVAHAARKPATHGVVEAEPRWYGLGDHLKIKGSSFSCWLMYVRASAISDDPFYAVSLKHSIEPRYSHQPADWTEDVRYEHLADEDQKGYLQWITNGRPTPLARLFTMIHFRGIEARYFAHLRKDSLLTAPELRAIEERVCDLLRPFSEDRDFATPLLEFLELMASDTLTTDPLCTSPLSNLFLFHESTLLRVMTKRAAAGATLEPSLVSAWGAMRARREEFFRHRDPAELKECITGLYEDVFAGKFVLRPTYVQQAFRYSRIGCSGLAPSTVDFFLNLTAEDLSVGNLNLLLDRCKDELISRGFQQEPRGESSLQSGKTTPSRIKTSNEVRPRTVEHNKARSRPSFGNPGTARAASVTSSMGIARTDEAEKPAKRRKRLDWSKVAVVQSDSAISQRYLGAILASEEDPATPPVSVEGAQSSPGALLHSLAGRTHWSRSDLEALARSHGIMLDGALSQLNEQALDQLDSALLYGEDPIEVDQDVAAQLLHRMEM